LPNPAGFTWQRIADGFNKPLDLQNAGDGSGRIFVVEQPGRIRIIQGGQVLPDPFLDIRERVGDEGFEQGLLGLAFHPRYRENGFFYVNYTDNNGNTVIARFSVSATDPNRADPSSELKLLGVQQPYRNHNGGGLAFGPDGYLYIGLGDGGSGGDPLGAGQSLNTLLGKILRIDVNQGERYAIPADNPYAGSSEVYQEIWAYGLRNPWRFSFDPVTGDLYIADVGQNKYEEVNFTPAGTPGGLNFGWDFYEASQPFEGTPGDPSQYVFPVAEYAHGPGCSVTGGVVYRGAALPEFYGVYLYGDYCSGQVWGLLRTGEAWQNQQLFRPDVRITAFGVDESGEVYLIDQSGGIYQLVRR
ncbi:MAG: PQQ-dependent sugar dehydrogenase, partial [Anaerolineales bacterium]